MYQSLHTAHFFRTFVCDSVPHCTTETSRNGRIYSDEENDECKWDEPFGWNDTAISEWDSPRRATEHL